MEHSLKMISEPPGYLHKELIFKNIGSPLSSIPFHHDIDGIERLFAEGFPLHLAIHQIHEMPSPPSPYTRPHAHEFAEINILIGDELRYQIQLANEIYELKGSFSIWIPAGVLHAANVIQGTGYFVAIRLNLNS
jgi:hypothetical protein